MLRVTNLTGFGNEPNVEFDEASRTSFSGFSNWLTGCFRTVIPEDGQGLKRNCYQIRVTFSGLNCAEDGDFDDASVGIRSSGANCTATPTALLFSTLASGTIPSGGLLTSDWLTFSAQFGDELMISMDMTGGAGSDQTDQETTAANIAYWKLSDDCAGAQNMPAGFTTGAGDNVAIYKVETRNWPV